MGKESTAKKMKRWSYSAWSTWKGCAYKYYCGYVMGVREPPNQFMARGIEIHRQQEFFLKGEINTLPPVFESFMPALRKMKRVGPIVEEFWGVDELFKRKDYPSWCVMKMDAAVAPEKMGGWLYIQDLKSGREYEQPHFDQAELYSCIGVSRYPDIKGVIFEFYYLDQGYPTQYKFPLKHLIKRQNFWMEQGHKMLNPKQKFLPTATEYGCKYCFHRSDRNGDCTAWKTIKQLRYEK